MKPEEQEQLISQYGATHIVQLLQPYVTTRRQQRINQVIAGRVDGIQLAIEAPSDINNALAAVRTCEALGVSNVHIINPEGAAGSVKTITQGAFYWTDIHYHHSLSEFLPLVKSQSYLLAGGTVNATTALNELPIDQPLCVMIGNEQRGLSDSALTACDIHYTIPMYGMSESLNLSVSAAISLYDTTQRKRQRLDCIGNLNEHQQIRTRAKYYLHSVDDRITYQLLKSASSNSS